MPVYSFAYWPDKNSITDHALKIIYIYTFIIYNKILVKNNLLNQKPIDLFSILLFSYLSLISPFLFF